MKHEYTSEGDLKISLETKEDKAWLQTMSETKNFNNDVIFLDTLINHTQWYEYGLERLRPEQVGVLTESPIISDSVCRDDTGNIIDVKRLWWFPSYVYTHFAEELLSNGSVTFTLAQTYKELP